MFENKSILEILSMGGATLYILLFVSIISVTIIIFKFFEFKTKNRISVQKFMKKVRYVLTERKDIVEVCKAKGYRTITVTCTEAMSYEPWGFFIQLFKSYLNISYTNSENQKEFHP